jgi:chemotaxis methyl-accepting protein methylase
MTRRLSTNVAVLDHELSEIRLLLERYAGVLFDDSSEHFCERFEQHLRARHLNSAAELLGLLQTSESERAALAEHLLEHAGQFFRWPRIFETLGKTVLPEIQARKASLGSRNLRIWSAGCGGGEEPYSIAMTVCGALEAAGPWNVHIVATDIRRQALEHAERGLYDRRVLNGLSQDQLRHYFVRLGDQYLVKPRLRNLVSFAPMNLADPPYLGRFDCIFCLDVLPHFSMPRRSALVERLHLYLEPGGCLFVGEGERLPAHGVTFHSCSHQGYTAYQKPLAAAARSGKG